MTWMAAIALALFAQDATQPAESSAKEAPKAIAWQSNVREAQADALQRQRLLVVFITSKRCKYCTKMKQTTLVDPAVVGAIHERCVAVAGGAEAAAAVSARERVASYPLTLLVSPDGKVLDRIKGCVSAKEFLRRVTESQTKIVAAKPATAKPTTDKPAAEVAAQPEPSSRRAATKR